MKSLKNSLQESILGGIDTAQVTNNLKEIKKIPQDAMKVIRACKITKDVDHFGSSVCFLDKSSDTPHECYSASAPIRSMKDFVTLLNSLKQIDFKTSCNVTVDVGFAPQAMIVWDSHEDIWVNIGRIRSMNQLYVSIALSPALRNIILKYEKS